MLKLGQIILFTKSIAKLSTFMCEIFDLEIDNSRDSVRLVNEDFNFLLIERSDLLHGHNDVMIDIFVNDFNELSALKGKFEFYQYRQNQSSVDGLESNRDYVCEIKDIGIMQFVFMVDPDGRRWKISHQNLS